MKTSPIAAKIAVFDIETSPLLGYSWERWFPNGGRLLKVVKDRQLLCAALGWYDEAEIQFKRVQKYGNDGAVAEWLRQQGNKADLLVAHNGKRFDVVKARTRMMAGNRHAPDSNPPVLDTLDFAKRHCGFTGNSLDDLLEFFGHPRKKKVDFDLWLDVMAGKPKAWKKMKLYNMHDTKSLKLILNDLLPWMLKHPTYRRLLLYPKARCPKCQSRLIQSRGKQWACQECGKWWLKGVK